MSDLDETDFLAWTERQAELRRHIAAGRDGRTQAAGMAICWICNQVQGTTGEHKSKRSDLKGVFGSKGGLYLHTEQRRNRRVQSIDSKFLKFGAPMCETCNGARTQPHDLAWEALSYFLRTRKPAIKPGAVIRCNRVFPTNTSQKMLGVHLFFVKWLGCQIVEAGIAIRPPIETFSQAIMTGRAHPNLWLSFGCTEQAKGIIMVSGSEVDADSLTAGAGFDYLARFYNVDRLAVRVRFSSVRLPNDWHPQDRNRFVIQDFCA